MHYDSLHRKIYRVRGKAREHICVTCGKPAYSWAYDGTDKNELTSKKGQRYSLDVMRYNPMCASCHLRNDTTFEQRSAAGQLGAAAQSLESRRKGGRATGAKNLIAYLNRLTPEERRELQSRGGRVSGRNGAAVRPRKNGRFI